MGRLILLVLMVYIALVAVRLVRKLLSGAKRRSELRKSDNAPGPPWNNKDIQDADFEEIE